MGKNKDKKKAKAVEPVELSKKDRKALEAREAELAAELERRAVEKAEKKKAKKGKKSKPEKAEKSAKQKVSEAADEALATPSSKGARIAAETAKAAANDATEQESDEEIKARVKSKRARRAELAEIAKTLDRDDEVAVAAYNAELATLGGGEFLTSTAEKASNDARFVESIEAQVAEVKTIVEAIETETGTVYAAGAEGDEPDADETGNIVVDDGLGTFAKPSEAPKTDFETNGNGQYKIKRPADGKTVGYTRATTYIKVLEDTTALTKWKLRMLLEGVAINDTEPTSEREDRESNDPTAAVMADLIHRRDVKIAKAHKADRKGKLGVGELGAIVEGAWAEFKKAVNALAEDLLETGGAHVAAQKGTDLHALTEVVDLEGLDAVGEKLERGEISPADFADMVAYRDALEAAGIKVVKEHVEQVIVRHDLKVAGRLDRVFLVKLPGMQRAIRVVGDLKTGNIEWAPGTIAQQLDIYAHGKGYDLNTHEEIDLKLNRTKAIVVNLRPGSAKATVHVVDLVAGHKANALAGQVRAWRNEGKRAIDFKVDLADASTIPEASAE